MNIYRKMLKILSLLLCLITVLHAAPMTASAAPEEISRGCITDADPGADPAENDQLFALYAEQKFYGYEMSAFGTRGREKLNDVEKAIYDVLKPQLQSVAASGGSTVFVMPEIDGLKTAWTKEELGLSSIESTDEVEARFAAQFNLTNINKALQADCPFDLYWYDKTEGLGLSYGIQRSGYRDGSAVVYSKAAIKELTFSFCVAPGYQGGSDTAVKTDVAKVNAVKAAAQAVVDANEGKSDYEKLLAYSEYICGAVSYNDAAADPGYTGGYGDPWQLIYVFDGDPDTAVVCEGYSKAFQYLCDLGGLDCISVSGIMSSDTDAGPHMWNVVTLEGQNYLVDVTNSDAGTVGSDGSLFMTGAPYSGSSYSFICRNQNIQFHCDDLDLAEKPYTPGASLMLGDLDLDGDVDSDDLTLLARQVAGIEHMTGDALRNCDVNADNEVNSDDLTLHARYVAGIIHSWDQE